jgi:hypothetical protein
MGVFALDFPEEAFPISVGNERQLRRVGALLTHLVRLAALF